MNREETRECLPANYCDLPDPCQVSRFLSHFLTAPRVFTDNKAVVTNPIRGALALFARARTKPQKVASPSAACSFDRCPIFRCDSLRAPARMGESFFESPSKANTCGIAGHNDAASVADRTAGEGAGQRCGRGDAGGATWTIGRCRQRGERSIVSVQGRRHQRHGRRVIKEGSRVGFRDQPAGPAFCDRGLEMGSGRRPGLWLVSHWQSRWSPLPRGGWEEAAVKVLSQP